MARWAVAEAKAKFSEVLDRAEREGPQVVRRRGEEFVIATLPEYEKAVRLLSDPDLHGRTSGKRLWEELRVVPDDGIEVELEKPRWTPRQVEL